MFVVVPQQQKQVCLPAVKEDVCAGIVYLNRLVAPLMFNSWVL